MLSLRNNQLFLLSFIIVVFIAKIIKKFGSILVIPKYICSSLGNGLNSANKHFPSENLVEMLVEKCLMSARDEAQAGNARLCLFPCAEIKYGIAARRLQFPWGKVAQKSPGNSSSDTFGCQSEM